MFKNLTLGQKINLALNILIIFLLIWDIIGYMHESSVKDFCLEHVRCYSGNSFYEENISSNRLIVNTKALNNSFT